MNPFIFRKHDIRGIWGQDWEAKDAFGIGAAFATWLRDKGENKIIVGQDNRLSSEKIFEAFTKGILSVGLDVIDLGVVSTPLIYFSRQFLKIKAAAEITASHNPAEWNGLKLCYDGKTTIPDTELKEIKAILDSAKFSSGFGKIVLQDLKKPYLDSICKSLSSFFPKENTKKIKVVIDSGNGVGGLFGPELFRSLGCDVIDIHSRLDGTFPNHEPDPSAGKNMVEICVRVVQEKADLGIAFDGDMDRVNIVDDKGFTLWGDGLVMFFARDILKRRPGAKIIFNSQCSPAVEEDIVAHGGVPHLVATGHGTVAKKLELLEAPFAGEYKGHMFFSDGYFGFDDALYAAGRFVRILSDLNVPLSQFMCDVPFFRSTGEILVSFPDDKKFIVEKAVSDALSEKNYVQDLEGDARIKFDGFNDAWGLVRNSDTMPYLEVFAWAKSDLDLKKVRDIMMGEVEKYL